MTIDLFDALENKHYAEYIGHGICDAGTLAIVHNSQKCAYDSGQIWFRGEGQGKPDLHFGFEGILNGHGTGGPDTQQEFLHSLQPFLTRLGPPQ